MSEPGPEEGGEDVFDMPKYCVRFKCQSWERLGVVKPTLVERDGFMVCPLCGSSYGKAPQLTAKDRT